MKTMASSPYSAFDRWNISEEVENFSKGKKKKDKDEKYNSFLVTQDLQLVK